MALVICSNEWSGVAERTSDINQPYTFINHLSSGQLTLPKNSEVAVQSVKINKDGTIPVKPSDIFYVYIGQSVGVSASLANIDLGTGYPVQVRLTESDYHEDLSITEFNTRIQSALNSGCINLAFSKLATSAIKRNASTNAFEGFELSISQKNASDTSTLATTKISPYWSGYESYFTYTGQNFVSVGLTTGDNRYKRVGIITDAPLGNVGGKFKVGWTNGSGTGTSWAVGLRRSRFNNGGFVSSTRKPEYFTINGQGLASRQFYDYVVMSIQDGFAGNRKLRVFQSSIRTSSSAGDEAMSEDRPIQMREIIYYGGHNSAFATPYDMSTNFTAGSSYDYVEFDLIGEQLNLGIGAGIKASDALVNLTVNATSTILNLFKPCAITTDLLYPQLWLQNANKLLKVTTFTGRTGYTFGDPKTDWWARMEKEGLTNRFCKRVDTRKWAELNASNAVHNYILPKAGEYNAAEYGPILVVSQDPDYDNSVNANCGLLLGFDNFSAVTNPVYAAPKWTFVSASIPSLTSRGSAFVRLNNFTQESYNAGKGFQSKILYHVPRFDNSGNDTGSDLFFEPTEKTYISLNNTNELHINAFDIDIVTEQEILSTDLVGKTIVVLHFRQQKK